MKGYSGSGSFKKRAAKLQVERLESRELLSAAMIPLNDLGTGTYQTFLGGLYPNGTDTRPATIETYADNLAQQIVPLDASGKPDAVHGKVAMVSIGLSNTQMEFSAFQDLVDADKTKNPQLVFVNGAQGGADVDHWVDPNGKTWGEVDQQLKSASVTPAQVEVAWVKLAEEFPHLDGAFPLHAQHLQGELEAVYRDLLIRYPDIKIAYVSTRTHAYTTDLTSANPEPYAYETGFAVKWAIQDQIDGTGNLNYDPTKGKVVAPLLLWGPYIWGTDTPRSDGFVWLPSDVNGDHVHPSPSGEMKVAGQLQAFFKTDPTATPWFLKPTTAGQGPSVTTTVSATSGSPGLTVHFTSTATDPGATVTQYAWTYDDGGFSLEQDPTKSFLVPGTYNVQLTVSDSKGNTTQQTIAITVNGAPTLAATTTAVASSAGISTYGQQMTFTATVGVVAPGTGTPTGTVQFVIDGTDFGSPVSLTTVKGITSASIALSSLSAGTHSLEAFYSGDSNFSPSNGTLSGGQSVNPAPLTITAVNQNMVYGGVMPTLTASYQGFVNGDTSASLTTPPTLATVAAGSHAGSYAITAANAVDPNYAISYVSGTLTIAPAPLTITADNQSMVYGATLPTLTASYSGLVNGDTPNTFTVSPNTAPGLATVPASSHTGSYAITVSGATDPDYSITLVAGALTITRAALTIRAGNQSMLHGGPLPVLTASYQGLVNGDTAASLTTPVTLATTVTAASPPGSYPITASSATDPNYTITFVPGTLTVSQVSTSLAVSASSSNPAFGQQVSLTAVVSATAGGSGFPTGTVQFQVNGNDFGNPVPVSTSNGVTSAVLSTAALPVGRLTVTADYSGDSNFASSLGSTGVISGTDNQRWVGQLYLDLLNRPADSFGMGAWTAALAQGASRTQVAQAILASSEYLTDVVEGYYHLYLHRAADPSGLTGWVSFLESGATKEQVQAAITGSPEYFQSRGRGTVTGFLAALYQDGLARTVDVSGQSVFSAAMANGATPAAVAAAIFSSDEYRQDLVRADFEEFLHRPADDFGLTSFLGALRSGTPDQEVSAVILGSGEYFSRV